MICKGKTAYLTQYLRIILNLQHIFAFPIQEDSTIFKNITTSGH